MGRHEITVIVGDVTKQQVDAMAKAASTLLNHV